MLFKLKPIVAALCLLTSGAFASLALATAEGDQKQLLEEAMAKMASQSEQVEQQMIQLQRVMIELQLKQKSIQEQQIELLKQVKGVVPTQAPVKEVASIQEPVAPKPAQPKAEQKPAAKPQPKSLPAAELPSPPEPLPLEEHSTVDGHRPPQSVEQGPVLIEDNGDSHLTQIPYGYSFLNNIGGTAVVTAPFIQSRYQFGGGGLITNYSSIDKDVSVLRQRKEFYNEMTAMGFLMPGYPLLEISGQLNMQVNATRPYDGDTTSDINLSTAELDFQALINPWFTGFLSFIYNSLEPSDGGNRVTNSTVLVDNAFITIGNLNQSPFYMTMGQIYVPFGQFDSYMISNSTPKTLFRTLARPILFGYQSQGDVGPYGTVYVFRDDIQTGMVSPDGVVESSSDHLKTVGADLGYVFEIGKLLTDVRVSYISNVADSLGMQFTGAPSSRFEGFGISGVNEVIEHRVPGVDVLGEFFYEDFALIAEYATATREFSPVNLSFNGDGAQPQALHVEGVYTFDMWARPSSLAIGYDHTRDALGLNVPESRASITLNTSIWRNTLASLEFRHDTNYDGDDTASGTLSPIFGPTGRISNAVTGQFNIYF